MRISSLVFATYLAAIPAAAVETVSFDEIPAQNSNRSVLSEEYAHLGVHFVAVDDGGIWDGMSNGDPGGWELDGSNGPSFLGFNGRSFSLTVSFDEPVPAFRVDVAAAAGADPGGTFAVAGYRDGVLVDQTSVVLGGLNEWMTVELNEPVDTVVWMGDTTGFRPFGADNMQWGVDGGPTRVDAAIDVRPGSSENPLNPGSQGVVPVALLGSPDLDVMNVDPASLLLGVDGAAVVGSSVVFLDANDDGWNDLVGNYPVPDTGTAYGDTSICLTGATFDGVEVAGCDAIRTVPQSGSSAQATRGRR